MADDVTADELAEVLETVLSLYDGDRQAALGAGLPYADAYWQALATLERWRTQRAEVTGKLAARGVV